MFQAGVVHLLGRNNGGCRSSENPRIKTEGVQQAASLCAGVPKDKKANILDTARVNAILIAIVHVD